MEKLDTLCEKTLSEIDKSDDLQSLDAIRVSIIGKKGKSKFQRVRM